MKEARRYKNTERKKTREQKYDRLATDSTKIERVTTE